MSNGEEETRITPPGGVPDFDFDEGRASSIVNETKGLTGSDKAVWYTRPVPIYGMPSTTAQIDFASQPGNPMINTWYSKSDVKSNYAFLPPELQALYTATAKSFSKRKTGEGLFDDLVDQAGVNSTTGNRVLPHQLLYQVASKRGILQPDGTFNAAKWIEEQEGSGKKYGTTSSTARQTNVSLTDPDTATAVIDNALEAYLGQSASSQQKEDFMKALRLHETKSPTVSTQSSTTTTSPGGSSSAVTSFSEGGSNPQQFAEEWAKSQEGSAEFLAATDYLDGFMNALKNSTDVVG